MAFVVWPFVRRRLVQRVLFFRFHVAALISKDKKGQLFNESKGRLVHRFRSKFNLDLMITIIFRYCQRYDLLDRM